MKALLVTLVAASAIAIASPASAEESFEHGIFGRVVLYQPAGPPRAVVLFLSGDGGWNLGVVTMARRLQGLGAVVAGIDIRTVFRHLEASPRACVYPAGDFEELSRAVQLRLKLPEYRPPILVGYSSGASLAYALLASAPAETFAGAISLGYCAGLDLRKPLCASRGYAATPRQQQPGYDFSPAKDMQVPWFVLEGDLDKVCAAKAARAFVAQVPSGKLFALPDVGHGFGVAKNWDARFVEAYASLAAPRAEPGRPQPGADAPDLPLVEVPAATGSAGDLMAVLLTGDGGWAEIDKGIAGALAERGVPVVGWSSLRYYWTPRTPEGAASDLDAVLRHYLAAWNKSRALLVGYSFGADVLPFLAARLPAETRAKLAGAALVGLEPHAQFEFHVAGWLGADGEARYPTAAEIVRLKGLRVLCIHGEQESDSACPSLAATSATVVALPGGHHFGGDYARLGDLILARLQPANP